MYSKLSQHYLLTCSWFSCILEAISNSQYYVIQDITINILMYFWTFYKIIQYCFGGFLFCFFVGAIIDILVSGIQPNELVFVYITKWSPQ